MYKVFYIPKTKAEAIQMLLDMGIGFTKTKLQRLDIKKLLGIYCERQRRLKMHLKGSIGLAVNRQG